MTVMRFPLCDDELTGDPAAEERSHEAESATPVLHAPDPEPEGTIAQILAERRKTHGDFAENARIAQSLKRVLKEEEGWGRLTDDQRETLDMIAHKVGRILAGDPNFEEHWVDIAGYSTRSADRVRVRSHPAQLTEEPADAD